MASNPYDSYRDTLPNVYYQDVYYKFFSRRTIDFISQQVTRHLDGVHPLGKNIIVPDEQIVSVMDSYYTNAYRKDPDMLTMMTIAYIANTIRTEFEMEANNNKLNVWVTNYTRDTGLQRHPKIKLLEKHPARMQFNMNY